MDAITMTYAEIEMRIVARIAVCGLLGCIVTVLLRFGQALVVAH